MSSDRRKGVTVIVAILLIAAIVVVVLPAFKLGLITKDPSVMVLTYDDVPSGFLPIWEMPTDVDNLLEIFMIETITPSDWIRWGYEKGYESCFYFEGDHVGWGDIYSLVIRFSNTEGTRGAINSLHTGFSGLLDELVTPELGDNCGAYYRDIGYAEAYIILFRKVNVLAWVVVEGDQGFSSFADAIKYARMVEGKI